MRWSDERVDDMISLRGVKIDPGQVVPHVQRALGYALQTCRCFKNRQDGVDWLEVWIAVSDELFSDEIKMLQKTIREVGDSLQEGLGVPVIVRLREKSTCGIPGG
jgi:phenylacetate-CoA ligase